MIVFVYELIIAMRLIVYKLRDGTQHDHSLRQRCVLLVGDDHPLLPALRHAAEVHVQEGLPFVAPLGDLHDLRVVWELSQLALGEDQLPVNLDLVRILTNSD